MGKDVNKLKAKGGGKFKYMAEKDMLDLAAKFAPYRYVPFLVYSEVKEPPVLPRHVGAFSCGTCGG